MVESYKGLFSGQSIPEDGEERGESARNRVTINLSGTNKGKDTVRTIKTTANRMTVCVCCVCVCVCVLFAEYEPRHILPLGGSLPPELNTSVVLPRFLLTC